MQAAFEWNIQKALSEQNRTDFAIDSILKKWAESGYDRQSTRSVFNLLINGGYYLTLYSQVVQSLEKNIHVDFQIILLLLLLSKHFNKEMIDLLLNMMSEDDLNSCMKYSQFDQLDERIQKIRENILAKEFLKKEKAKQKIIKQLTLTKDENLIEEEKRIYDSIINNYINDKEIAPLYEDFQKRYANKIFSKPKPLSKFGQIKNLLFKDEKQKKINKYEKKMKSLAKKHPEHSYMIAVSLAMSECYETAIEIIETHLNTEDSKWLYLELLIKAEKFVLALDYAIQLEEEFSDSPEKAIASLYQQAICHRNLNNNQQALNIIQSILKFDPDYKLAKHFYVEWSDE